MLARLLKWWSASVFVDGFFNGRSFRMEMFAVLAAQEEKNDDILRGFRIALDKIRNYQKVNVIFDRFYSPSNVPHTIGKQRPLLMDPANPRNNLLSPDVHKFFDKLAGFAAVTLDRLDNSERCGKILPDLFAPQPSVWSGLSQKPIEESWVIGTVSLPHEKQPRIQAQKGYVLVKVLEVAAHVIGGVLAAKEGSFGQEDVQRAINTIIVGKDRTWRPVPCHFHTMDALAIFPIHDSVGTCVVAGFNVEKS